MFWDNFYNACIQKGIKPNPLAKQLNIASGSMTTWKNGKIPNGETLIKIADYLDVSVDYLLGRTDTPNTYSISNQDTTINGTQANVINNTEKQDEMTEELVKAFKSMSLYNSHDLAISIKSIAKEKNITIKDMLTSCELGSNTMSSLYHGKSIAFDSVAKIADYLGVSVDYLLGRTDEPTGNYQINTGDVGNNSNVNINKSNFSDTDNELISEFKKLTFNDKAKVMSLIAELSEKKA